MDRDLKRFAQACRREVRLYVKEHGQAPPLLAFVPDRTPWGSDLRHAIFTGFEGAKDHVDVRATIREAVEVARAPFVGVGRMLAMTADHSKITSSFALVVIGPDVVEAWATSIFKELSGKMVVAPWEPVSFSMPDWAFAQAALKLVAKEEASVDA
jgi:hypothetical protein